MKEVDSMKKNKTNFFVIIAIVTLTIINILILMVTIELFVENERGAFAGVTLLIPFLTLELSVIIIGHLNRMLSDANEKIEYLKYEHSYIRRYSVETQMGEIILKHDINQKTIEGQTLVLFNEDKLILDIFLDNTDDIFDVFMHLTKIINFINANKDELYPKVKPTNAAFFNLRPKFRELIEFNDLKFTLDREDEYYQMVLALSRISITKQDDKYLISFHTTEKPNSWEDNSIEAEICVTLNWNTKELTADVEPF